MRDALSIMDQAIASAPVHEGKARLDAGQIRELMGTVPNAVFERVLQAVNENRSAEVMIIANELLDAGNSPAQLARQAVRYLRSCVIAKISGMTPDSGDSELLQISPEEQRRAARTAALFTEEELTRFLQTMLRTFDELGYRQEQRFHFELGLLKLVHLRRLLPVEEILSSLSGARPASTSPGPKPGPVSVPRPSAPPTPAKPAFSPFEQNSQRRKYDGIQSHESSGANALAPAAATPLRVAQPAPTPQPVPVPPAPLKMPEPASLEEPPAPSVPHSSTVPPSVSGATPEPALVPDSSTVPPSISGSIPEVISDPAAIRKAIVEALIAAGQGSAADAIEDATLTASAADLTIKTQISKTMLSVHINPEAEKIAKAALRPFGLTKLLLLPGERTITPDRAPRATKPGSAKAKAMDHPLVQRGRELFEAEIQTVIDLSTTD